MTDARKALESAREALTTTRKFANRYHCDMPTLGDDEALAALGDTASEALAAIDAALASGEQGQAPKPDYCYDPAGWEFTCDWSDRINLTEEMPLGEIRQIATLLKGPDKWAAHVPITWHEGEPDETEIKWFDSEAEAIAARAGAAPPSPETRT